MYNVIDWLNSLLGSYPQLSWLSYIFGFIILLIIIDAFVSLLFAAIGSLFRGK